MHGTSMSKGSSLMTSTMIIMSAGQSFVRSPWNLSVIGPGTMTGSGETLASWNTASGVSPGSDGQVTRTGRSWRAQSWSGLGHIGQGSHVRRADQVEAVKTIKRGLIPGPLRSPNVLLDDVRMYVEERVTVVEERISCRGTDEL